jgi:hypothetical protein
MGDATMIFEFAKIGILALVPLRERRQVAVFDEA